MIINETVESEVRSYCRHFPVVFSKAKMSTLYSISGKAYLDFFSGAGSINYGHNNDEIISPIIEYLNGNGLIQGLDMYTEEKIKFMECFVENILQPRNLNYKMMFCGPTGTNANEAALKLARKYTGRQNVFAFMGGFHGMSQGSLSITSSNFFRDGAGIPLSNVTFFPFCGGFHEEFDSINYMENILKDDHSGIEKPAAIFLETIQAEGGINIASDEWLCRLERLCRKHGILLVVDDVQVGCGRTGTFFSFESYGIVPDIVTMSKSISGSGLPMSLLLMKPEIDCFKPGEHNGTFRGNQLAFIGGRAAIEYAINNDLWDKVSEDGLYVEEYIINNILTIDERLHHRGKGLIHGIDFADFDIDDLAGQVAKECFNQQLVIELAGRKDCVLKLLPPLVITREELLQGLEIIKNAILVVLEKEAHSANRIVMS